MANYGHPNFQINAGGYDGLAAGGYDALAAGGYDGLAAGWPLTFPSPDTGHNANLATPGSLSSAADNLLPNSHALFNELNDLLPSSSVQYSSTESHGTLDESWYAINLPSVGYFSPSWINSLPFHLKADFFPAPEQVSRTTSLVQCSLA